MVKGFKYSKSLCFFLLNVVCPHRGSVEKRKRFSIPQFCVGKCEHFLRFERESEADDERLMDGIDRIHELTERFKRGEFGEVEYHRLLVLVDNEIDGDSG